MADREGKRRADRKSEELDIPYPCEQDLNLVSVKEQYLADYYYSVTCNIPRY